jgi:hypothetical protein
LWAFCNILRIIYFVFPSFIPRCTLHKWIYNKHKKATAGIVLIAEGPV